MVAFGAVVAILVGSTLVIAMPYLMSGTEPAEDTITLTLLYNAGVMIESGDVRIYIDPIDLPSNYSQLPADAVLVTHPHGDHYNTTSIDLIQQESTVNVFPSNMSDAVAAYDGVGVVPGTTVMVGDVNITAFYMYTIPPEGYTASHPLEANWTSYIIDIKGFTIFHAGDSKNITEYEMLRNSIDVVLLPLGPGCQTMYLYEVVDAIDKIQPGFFIPIHYIPDAHETFIRAFDDDIEAISECVPIGMDYWTSHTFILNGTQS